MNGNNSVDRSELIERLDRLLDWIKSCDTKTSIVLAIIGIFLAIFTTELSVNTIGVIFSQTIHHIDFANILFLFCVAASCAAFVYGGYCLIRVLIPRLSKDASVYEGIYTDSLYFFEAIAKNDFREFKDKVTNRNEEDDNKDILSQIYINAKICTIKFAYYRKGIKFTFIGLTGMMLLYAIGLTLVKVGGFS